MSHKLSILITDVQALGAWIGSMSISGRANRAAFLPEPCESVEIRVSDDLLCAPSAIEYVHYLAQAEAMTFSPTRWLS